MCDILNERIRIDKILSETISQNAGSNRATMEELTQLCSLALQAEYHGACVEECVETAARDFAARFIARRDSGRLSPQGAPIAA